MVQLRSALLPVVTAFCCFLSPEAANSNNPRLLFFTASRCAPRQKMKPAVEDQRTRFSSESQDSQ
jgi:hypothetical protein